VGIFNKFNSVFPCLSEKINLLLSERLAYITWNKVCRSSGNIIFNQGSNSLFLF